MHARMWRQLINFATKWAAVEAASTAAAVNIQASLISCSHARVFKEAANIATDDTWALKILFQTL